MIQTKRKTPKEENKKSLEETVKEQAEEIASLKKALDDVILSNGGAV